MVQNVHTKGRLKDFIFFIYILNVTALILSLTG